MLYHENRIKQIASVIAPQCCKSFGMLILNFHVKKWFCCKKLNKRGNFRPAFFPWGFHNRVNKFEGETIVSTKGSPKGKKAALLLIFTEGGGAQSNAHEELCHKPFFSLRFDIFKERGGAQSKPFEELLKLKFGHFPRKGEGRSQIQTF